MQNPISNINELDTHHEQRLLAETLQEVTLVFASQTDPAAVLDEILRQAQRLVPCKTSSITLLENDTLRVVRSHGYHDVGSATFVANLVQRLSDLPLDRQVVQNRKPLVIADVRQEPGWVTLKETAWIRSVLVVPIWWANQVLGLLRFDSPMPSTFSIKDAERLQPLANAAAIALENARLIEKVQQHAAQLEQRVAERTTQLEQYSRRQAALAEFELAINLPQELEALLQQAAYLTARLLPASRGAYLTLRAAGLGEFEFCTEAEDKQRLLPLIHQHRLWNGELYEPMIVSNVDESSQPEASILPEAGIQAYLGVPLLTQNEALGMVLAFDAQPRQYTSQDLDFMTALANRASVAITKVYLYKQLAEAKDIAEAASRAKSEFLANMSHELRTPLSTILGFTEVLAEQTFGSLNDKQYRYVKNILTSSHRLLSLINDLLDLAKIEAGRITLDTMPFDVAAAITEIIDSVKPLAIEKKQILTVNLDNPLPPLTADLSKFRKILRNLLTNAIKYTPENGQVTVTTKAGRVLDNSPDILAPDAQLISTYKSVNTTLSDGLALYVSVADTGIGLSKKDMQRIFGLFEQIDGAYNRQQQGTGLGLALTQRLVEMHGGRVWVKSQGPGTGSVFTFSIPFNTP
jgi:signal transduction histidine kinase